METDKLNGQQEELTREQQLELEEKAIQALLQMGAKFTVPLHIEPRKPSKWFNLKKRIFKKSMAVWKDKRIPKGWDVELTEIADVELGKMKEAYVRIFRIKPLYLGTIDRLRQLYLQIEYNEETLQSQPIQESKRLFRYIPKMAEIAAVAVINNSTVANPDNKQVKALAKFFIEHLTAARLQRLSEIIGQMMNPAGFTNSIRLIREVGTTRPKAEQRIE